MIKTKGAEKCFENHDHDLLILTVVWFTNSDSIQPAREFIQNNIYVWSEMQEEKTSNLLCRYAEKNK